MSACQVHVTVGLKFRARIFPGKLPHQGLVKEQGLKLGKTRVSEDNSLQPFITPQWDRPGLAGLLLFLLL